MEISGDLEQNYNDNYAMFPGYWHGTQSGALYVSTRNTTQGTYNGQSLTRINGIHFRASRNWTGLTSSNGNHTHTLTVSKNTSIYGNSNTVQPASLKVRVKTRAK